MSSILFVLQICKLIMSTRTLIRGPETQTDAEMNLESSCEQTLTQPILGLQGDLICFC